VPAKAPGVVRIGVVRPQLEIHSAEPQSSAESVLLMLADYLQGPTIEIALLAARLPSQYAIEAAGAECDFVLTLSLTHRRGRMSEALGKTLETFAAHATQLPSGDLGSSAVMSQVLSSVGDLAASVKARDQMELVFRLVAAGSAAPVLDEAVKRRAKSDGEDLLTPLVQHAAQAIGAELAEHGASQ
jgi:hypothetical protein